MVRSPRRADARAVGPWRRPLPPALGGTIAVLRLLPRVSRPMTLALAAGIFLATLLPLAALVVGGLLVGSVPAAVRGGLDSASGRHALTLLTGAALLIVGQRLLGPFLGALAACFGRRVDRHVQERAMAAVSRPWSSAPLEDPNVLDLIARTQGVGTQDFRPGDAVAALASLLPSWLQALGSAVILLAFRPWLGLGWLVLWPIILYYLQREFIRFGQAAVGQAAAMRRTAYYRDLALTPGAAKEVRLWGLAGWLEHRYGAAWLGAMMPIWQARRPGRGTLWIVIAVVTAANLVTFGLLAWAATRGEITLAALAVYSQAAFGAGSFRASDDPNMTLAYAAVAVPSLLALEERLTIPTPATADAADLPPGSPYEGMRCEGVTFRYPSQDGDTLVGVDLTVPAGTSLAIVGANGAGKTTLVKLLCRLDEPTAGRITVDGVDLVGVDPAAWRGRVAAIFQDFARYHLSARDNVEMGAPHLAGDRARLREAARKAGALDLIEGLPQGWETVLSREYTGGVDLSGGQWQRIALARALVAVEGGARILILDEPTANLDVRAEAELYDSFLELTAGLTTVVISHRFSTVRRAGQIVVLEGGRVVEHGTHDGLMKAGGRYATLFRLQADRFAGASSPVPGRWDAMDGEDV